MRATDIMIVDFKLTTDYSRLEPGAHRLPCPICDKGTHDKAMKVTVEPDGFVWYCHRCQSTGASRTRQDRIRAAIAPKPAPGQHLTLAHHWRSVWLDLKPIRGTLAEEYLRSRGCAIPPSDGDLRYGELRHPSGYLGPAMIALVSDALTGEPLTLHRTWIRADGHKASVEPPRLLVGKHRKRNGVIRLWPDDAVTTGLAIAEGIETALAVATAFTPVWSCIDAGNLAAFPVLTGIESMLIVADNDAVGMRAAHKCAQRWACAGREVRLAVPPRGMDAADLARGAT